MATNMTKLKLYRDRKTRYRWQLKAGNGVIIGASTQGYISKLRCLENCHNIQRALAGCFSDDNNYMIVDETNG